jgi:hypothetical protein
MISPTFPNYDETPVVSAVIADDSAVSSALLSYSVDDVWFNVSMSNVGNVFNATIPGEPYGTTVQYKIYANDTNGNSAVSSTYYYVVADSIPPQILSVIWTPTCPSPYTPSNVSRAYEPTSILVNISEPVNASGVSSVFFSYSVGDMTWGTLLIHNETNGLWTTLIPGYAADTHISFHLAASDASGNTATSEVYSFIVQQIPIGDVNGDGIVDVYDAILLALHFGEQYP